MRKPRGKINTLSDLFSFCFEKDPVTGCIEWKYGKHTHGYGRYRIGKVMEFTHRMAYKFTHPDEDISDLFICHKCDNPPCCNPDHLFSGTNRDNMDDMVAKGRAIKPGPHNPAKGENNGNSKVTQEQVTQIREIYRTVEISMKKLGKRYGLSAQQICKIIHNQRWRS